MLSPSSPARTAGTFNAISNLLPREVTEMERLGIPADALAGPTPVKASYIVFDNGGFEFEHHHKHGVEGVRAFLFLVSDSLGLARDVVAWAPQMNRLATWLGLAWALGEELAYRPRLSDGLPVWRSPVEWLRARRDGLCLVRSHVAAHYLDCAGPLLAEDAAHGAELRQLLTRPAPRILIPSSSRKTA
ncbi:hypothetical protein [Microvirga sesbaniae]|uniref:hypothetical protein n=1 Tax=Microvirga sesbaniae TaxID=681392 RepID=UPI0021C8E3D8|nr:hypothetical protein [Microvirga sp. HBU67692]